jgi:hypothetical protein
VVEESVWDMPPCHGIIGSWHFKGTFSGIWRSDKKTCTLLWHHHFDRFFLRWIWLKIWKFDAVLLSIVILCYYLLNLIYMTFQHLVLHPTWEVECHPDIFLYLIILRFRDFIQFSYTGII